MAGKKSDSLRNFLLLCTMLILLVLVWKFFTPLAMPAIKTDAENIEFGMNILEDISTGFIETKAGKFLLIRNSDGEDVYEMSIILVSSSPYGEHHTEKAMEMARKIKRSIPSAGDEYHHISAQYFMH